MENDPDARLAALQRRKLEQTSSVERIATNLEIASLAQDELGDLELAEEALREVLELDPTHAGAIDKLELVYTMMAHFSELADLYERRVDLTDNDDDRVATLLKLATLAETALEDHARAITALRGVLDVDPANARALGGLERLHMMMEDWSQLVDLMSARVELTTDKAARAELLERLAMICERELADEAQAAAFRARARS